MKEFLKNILPFNNRTEMPAVQFAIKKFLAFWLCYAAGVLIAEAIVIIIHFAAGKNPLEGEMFDPQTILLITYYGYIVVITVALLYWKLIEKKPLSDMGLSKNFGSYFIGAVIAVVLLVCSVGVITLAGGFEYQGIFANADIPVILLFCGGFIVQGAMEELLCRGLVLTSLKDRIPVPAAIGISTLVFLLPHIPSFEGGIYSVFNFIDLILVSIVFSLLTLYFGNIWAAGGLHSVWNFILFNILGLNLSGNEEKVTAIFNITSNGENIINGGAYGIEASSVTSVVLAVCAAILFVLYRKNEKA